jgi:DNA-binding NarL/FixJ family response regulator
MVALGLEGWGNMVATQGEPAWAARIFGTASAIREATGAPLPLADQAKHQEWRAAVRAALGEATFETAWKQGRGMTPEHVISHYGVADAIALSSAPRPVIPPVAALGLTRRELDVLRELAEGLTNRQIAERLIISVVTVNSYLRSIYSKMGVTSRTAAARYAIDHHLL